MFCLDTCKIFKVSLMVIPHKRIQKFFYLFMRKTTSIKLCCQTPDQEKKLNLTLAVQIPHPSKGQISHSLSI